ncbi:hypothetical protein L6E12_23605 [Actinokineospora sp. PR83]|uniref:hypothetical protein n=1 Tax=Actinokineospora sp. PR83 TaxID=2884908 RepID=UPI001F293488|nr:hypothetical protein [Actinokineospora sp. PR83]MCG8918772.1 hypothetical protein [Actinokineospora sp. PR83]
MRPTIVLLSVKDGTGELVSRCRDVGTYEPMPPFDRLTVGECWYGVDLSGRVIEDYEQDELAEIAERLGEFDLITLEYSGVPCIRTLLQALLPGLTGLLDTNFGELIGFDEVLSRFAAGPDWDWRG